MQTIVLGKLQLITELVFFNNFIMMAASNHLRVAGNDSYIGEVDNSDDTMIKLKKLSRLNGEVNRMNEDELIKLLEAHHLDTKGTKDVKRKRMKDFYRRQKLASKISSTPISYDYLCVMDFEATCEERNPENYQHEIIEFPAILLCSHSHNIVSEFHRFCKPVKNPKLTSFCQKLTGISQNVVDSADEFPKVMDDFLLWLKNLNLGTQYKFAVVTDSPWDMGRFLSYQCEISGIPFPKFGKKWINICKIFSNFYDVRRMSLVHMLEQLGMSFEGRQHCGLHDARNITRIAIQLMKDGAHLKINEWLQDRSHFGIQNSSEKYRSNNRHESNDKSKLKKVTVPENNHKSNSLVLVSDQDLGADPQVTYEDLENLVAFRKFKKINV